MIDLTSYNTVFLIVSCVEPNKNVFSSFRREERFIQLLKTVESCYDAPNSKIVITEGSELLEEEKDLLSNVVIIENHNQDSIKEALSNKQLGTISLWVSALDKISVKEDATIVFLAGRYSLSNHFTKDLTADFAFKMEDSWASEDLKLFHATSFKVKGKCKNEIKEVIKKCGIFYQQTNLDIEHGLWYFTKGKNIEYLEKVECEGFIGSDPNFTLNTEYDTFLANYKKEK